ncbi:hypothetical protein [Peribacillus aracenensis]|uniref:hypothetical protein n=1 Tax=Peribacillus aracenensis TaxID=2976708 RepID=UPI0021A8E389|nr:hypothetical protein [Peribacillus sp. BBB004]
MKEIIEQKKIHFVRVAITFGEIRKFTLEKKSSKALAEALKQEGFTVEYGVAGLDTEFIALYGSGHPIIGILGEFDALSSLSQQKEQLHMNQ